MKRNDLLAVGAAAAAAVGLAEGALRLRDRAVSKARFHRERWTLERSWERFDSLSGWELKPGYSSGGVHINRAGFRGPKRKHCGKRFRIACFGGNDTFGPPGEDQPYPAVLGAALNRENSDRPVEVVNAGVTGHSTYNMLFRIDRVLRLRPDLVIVYAGPEDMYLEDIAMYRDNRRRFSSYWHVDSQRNVRCHVWSLLLETAGIDARKPFPLSYTPGEFVPFNFDFNLLEIIARITHSGAAVALIAPPALIASEPSSLTPAEIGKISLPDYIEDRDLSAFRSVYLSYDSVIRSIAAQTESMLIDAASVFADHSEGRETFFEASGVLSEEGSAFLGETVAKELLSQGVLR
jgi:hypothetical protein